MKLKLILIALFLVGLVASAIQPHDYFTWFLEVIPAVIGLTALISTHHKFQFTTLTYLFILIHSYILFVGGHYTYAEVPLFDWVRDAFHQSRNNYDKVGHFAQGFIPAMIIRELLYRLDVVKKGAWLSFVTISICAAISAFYELIEWFVAISTGDSSNSFLGTQGDIWDTQSDMLWATIGALVMVVLFSKIQDSEIAKIKKY